MPSMHCAYPMLGLLTAWRQATWKTRPLHIAYVVWMATSALYLDHHWVLDVLGGWLVAIVAVIAATAAVKAAEGRSAATATATTRMADGRNAA
jgi:membrane-associated phospholipid phosphatase